jgi:hypothetical protein
MAKFFKPTKKKEPASIETLEDVLTINDGFRYLDNLLSKKPKNEQLEKIREARIALARVRDIAEGADDDEILSPGEIQTLIKNRLAV